MRIYRRHLPHWRRDRAIYFVTWRVAPHQPPLTVFERDQVAALLRTFDGRRFSLLAYVVMDDHVHTLVRPYPNHPLERIVHTWKSYSAHVLAAGGRSKVWQGESFDRIIRDEQELEQKLDYIINNPSRRWPGVEQYPWVWCRRELLD